MRLFTHASLLCLGFAGCSPTTEAPPLFNAVDPSQQCEAGQVGWDFSTGGNFDEVVRDAALSNELRIIEATYGYGCDGVAPGNASELMAASCNGRLRCSRRISDGLVDPAPGCAKPYKIRYACGTESTVYETNIAGESGPNIVTLECGDKMTIRRADYLPKGNCSSLTPEQIAALPRNATRRLAELCSGTRRCQAGTSASLLPTDPAPGCNKALIAEYTCNGAGGTTDVITFEEGVNIDFACPARPRPPPSDAVISVRRAMYGLNCSTRVPFDSQLAARCNGKSSCSFRANEFFPRDIAPGCPKGIGIEYECLGQRQMNSFYTGPREAGGDEIALKCGQPAHVIEASWGANCRAGNRGNKTAVVQESVEYASSATFPMAIFTADDPAVGCAKDFEVRWTCGDSEVEKTQVVRDGTFTVSCDWGTYAPAPATGIQLVDVTYGGACSNAPKGISNNAFNTLAYCSNQQACSGVFNWPGTDIAPNCPKDLSVTYRCGEDPQLLTVKVAGEASKKEFSLTCAPVVRVDSASYATSCGLAAGNLTSAAAQACNGKQGTCTYSIPARPSATVMVGSDVYRVTDPVRMLLGGAYALTLETGQLVLYRGAERIFSTPNPTSGAADRAALENGNLVVYGAQNAVLWSSNTGGNAGATLTIDTFGRLVIRSATDAELWSSATAKSCTGEFKSSYHCGSDPTPKTATLDGESAGKSVAFSCPEKVEPSSLKRCVPQFCTGPERRNGELACVPDKTLPILPALTGLRFNITGNDRPFDRGNPVLFEDHSYTLSLAFEHEAPCAACALPDTQASKFISLSAVYAVDTFKRRIPRDDEDDVVEGFRCIVTLPGLRPVKASGDVLLPYIDTDRRTVSLAGLMLNQPLPPSCFGNLVGSWRDAAKRQFMSEADFRSEYLPTDTRLYVSYDPTGRTVALRTSGTQPSAAGVPNPVGFFYDPKRLWVDHAGYYEQTKVASLGRVVFSPSEAITIEAKKATVRTNELEVSMYDAFIKPRMEIDLDWVLRGDAPGRNPLSPSGAPLSTYIPTLTQRHLAATVEITPADDFDALTSSSRTGWVANGKAMIVDKKQVTALGAGQSTGQTLRIQATFNDALRDRLLRPTSTSAGWMGSLVEETRNFRVRVCIDIDGLDRTSDSNNDETPLKVKSGATEYSAGFTKGKRCVVAAQNVVVRRDLERRPFPRKVNSTDGDGMATDRNQGDPTYFASQNNIGNESRCNRLCTATADCSTGQICNGSPTKVGFCVGPDAKVTCTNFDRNTMGSTGAIGRSLFSTTTKTTTEKTMTGTKSRVGASTEALGFTILSAGNDKEAGQPFTGTWQKFEISIIPNIDNIISILRAESLITQFEPVSAKFDKVRAGPPNAGRVGIGVGVGRQFLILVSPIPIAIDVGASVGIGVGATVSFELNTDGAYPCLGTDTCYAAKTTPATLDGAKSDCESFGGRLAEMENAGTLGILNQTAGNTSTDEFWIGAQLGYAYNDGSCVTNDAAAGCREKSRTSWRWLKSGNVFASQAGNGAVTATTSAINGGMNAGSLAADVVTQQPKQAGVTFKPSTQRFASRLRDSTTKYKYLCEYRPAASASAIKLGAGLTLDFSAGASAAVCVPTALAGVCLQASLQAINAELAVKVGYTNTKIYDAAAKLIGKRSNISLDVDWQVRFLTGAITAQLRMLLIDLEWEIIRYEGIQTLLSADDQSKLRGSLLHMDWPTYTDVP